MRRFIALLLLLCCLGMLTGCLVDKEGAGDAGKTGTRVEQPKAKQEFLVYRAAADGSEKLLPEKFVIDDNGKTPMENALQYLVATKPGNAKLDDVVPIGTKVLGLRLENGIAYADFSKELAKKGQGSYQEMMLTYAIVNTLTEFSEVKKVQILIEGKKVLSLSGHMDLEDPLTRNTSLLDRSASK